METIGIVATLVMLVLALVAAGYYAYKEITDYKAKVFRTQILPSVGDMLEDYTDEMLKKSMTFAKDWMKTLQEDL